VNDVVAVSAVAGSVTLQVTDVEPRVNTLPEAGAQSTPLSGLPVLSVASGLAKV
jgi:hypothetical protein